MHCLKYPREAELEEKLRVAVVAVTEVTAEIMAAAVAVTEVTAEMVNQEAT